MKKLIAISVILVLLTAAAFAETSFSAAVIVKGTLLEGTTQDAYPKYLKDGDPGYTADWEPEWYETEYDNPNLIGGPYGASGDNYKGVRTGIEFKRLRIAATTSNDEGTFGGHIRFDGPNASGFGWWKPIDALRIQLGQNNDGDFGADGVTRYGFYTAAGADYGVTKESWAFSNSFYGGWGEAGLLLTITPMEALAINLGIPLDVSIKANKDWGSLAEYAYKKTNAQVAYTIDGLGKIAVTYVGGALHKDAEKEGTDAKAPEYNATTGEVTKPGVSAIPAKLEVNDPASVLAYFGLTAIENLGLDIGIGYRFGYTVTNIKPAPAVDTADDDVKVNGRLSVGLGAQYDAGQFGVKARVQGDLLGGAKVEAGGGSYEFKEPLVVTFDVLPSFAVSDAVKVFLSAGGVFTGAAERIQSGGGNSYTERLTSTLDWHVNPYLTYSAGPGTFFAGFRLEGIGKRSYEEEATGATKTTDIFSNSYMNWSVPIGIAINF